MVCPYNVLRGGGVQECVLAMQRGLEQKGHTCRIITPTPPRQFGKPRRRSIVFVGGATEIKSPFATTAEVSVSANPDDLHQLLEKERFDILHFHEPWVPILSRQLLTRSSCINIATFHAKLPETVLSRTIERVITPYTRSVLKYFHGLTAVSNAAATYVRNLTKQPVEIIPNGIDLNKYQSFEAPATKTHIILYVGRLEKRKGVKYLIQAYRNLRRHRRDVRLVIAGDGPDRTKLTQFVQDNHIPDVQFLGAISERRKISLLRRARLFCSPALYGESFGIVLLEAMASGTVLVAGDNAGYHEVMKHQGTISLINPKATDEFARRMAFLIDDEHVRKNWQQWASGYVQQFDYPAVIDRYEQLYSRLLSAARPKSSRSKP